MVTGRGINEAVFVLELSLEGVSLEGVSLEGVSLEGARTGDPCGLGLARSSRRLFSNRVMRRSCSEGFGVAEVGSGVGSVWGAPRRE